jgi:hypothetical protein
MERLNTSVYVRVQCEGDCTKLIEELAVKYGGYRFLDDDEFTFPNEDAALSFERALSSYTNIPCTVTIR